MMSSLVLMIMYMCPCVDEHQAVGSTWDVMVVTLSGIMNSEF